MQLLLTLLATILNMSCSGPARADYTPYEPFDSLFCAIIDEAGLPECYRFLPILLTDCDTAYDGSYARGLWALSVPAAHHYGLLVTDSIDERLDASKSARAAAVYLQDLRRLTSDNDTLTLRRYAVCTPVLRVGTDSLLWALQQISKEYNDGRRTSRFLPPLDEVRNEAARADSIRRAEQARRAAEVAAQRTKAEPQMIIYRVRSGDVLGRIAMRYHVTISQLMRWNNLTSPDRIREGQTLKIYKS